MHNKDSKFMTKKETKPFKELFNEAFVYLRNKLLDKFSLKYKLVGSSKRNLVIKHHNKGFDLDYQIIITKFKEETKLKVGKIKALFLKFLKKFKKLKKYYPEYSTSAITLKNRDTKKSKIINSYDIVIMCEIKGELKILKRNSQDKYSFENLKHYENHYENLKQIKEKKLWQKLREIYYDKKIKNEERKEKEKSFLIFMKAAKETIDTT